MTAAANGVPANLTTRWNINARHELSAPYNINSMRKHNTSCNGCRKSRVKCSGGHPCQRCLASQSPYACIYSISQRRGKHKATEVLPENQQDSPIPSSETVPMLTQSNDWIASESLMWNGADMSINETGHNSLDQTFLSTHLSYESRNSPSLTDIIDSLLPPSPPPSTSVTDRGKCAESCFLPIHKMTNELMVIAEDSSRKSLEDVLSIFDESIRCSSRYLNCPNCDPGCPRIMNLSFLHQRQVNMLSTIVKDPVPFLHEQSARLTLGAYQLSREDDVALKRMLILRVVGDVLNSVNECQDRSEEFEHRFKAGTLDLGEIGKLNLKWLLDIAANLTKRLNCLKSLLESNDWALKVGI